MEDDAGPPPESLLPYEAWTESALREVVAQAIRHAGAHGLPGRHHYYLSLRTDAPGVDLPEWLRAKYPEEITVVLQHQFWDLRYDDTARAISVGLSFSGVPAKVRIPLDAITAFADPAVNYELRFHVPPSPAETRAPEPAPAPAIAFPKPEAVTEGAAPAPDATPQVVSLDAFRRRPSTRE
jgi:hypothetical protein